MNQQNDISRKEIQALQETIFKLRDDLESFKNTNINFGNNMNYYQLDINKEEAEYSFNFNIVNNVVGLNLASYSLPAPFYNFTGGLMKYYINDDNNITEHYINIDKGYYDYNSLLQTLNSKTENLEFIYNNQRKLGVKNKIENRNGGSELVKLKSFKFYFNKTFESLGFIGNNEFVTSLNAVKLLDLRVPTKIRLFITNLSNEPFGVLNFNGSSKCNIKFREPKSINCLNLVFLDDNNELYNFHNLKYNLSFQLQVLENLQNYNNLQQMY